MARGRRRGPTEHSRLAKEAHGDAAERSTLTAKYLKSLDFALLETLDVTPTVGVRAFPAPTRPAEFAVCGVCE